MAITDLEKLLRIPDPLLTFRWYAKSLPFGMKNEYMESIDLPFNNISISEGVHVGSRFDYYPGTHSISSFSASFYEDRLGTTLKWIEDWKSRVKDLKRGGATAGAYKLPADYKRTIEVVQMDNKGNPVITAKISGVWPADTSPMALNYSDGTSRIIHQQTFSADDVEFTFHM